MNLNDPRDTFFSKQGDALREQSRIIRRGGKAYVRRYNDAKRGTFYRLRVQRAAAV
jgi:hypothetical protein